MKSSIASLSVVLPAYNEETAIEGVVRTVVEYLNPRFDFFEIIVVDDGSEDETAIIVRSLRGELPSVRLVSHEQNRGYGEALRSGFNAARLDWVLLMDADGQFSIAALDDLMPYAASNSMVIGYRANRADPWLRAVFTWGYNKLVNRLFGLGIRDVGCAFKLFRRELWEQAQPRVARDHKVFSVEWLWRVKQAGISVKEVPVRHYPRSGGRQTGARPDVVWAMLREMVRLRLYG